MSPDQAQQLIDDMKAGRIVWDDNKLSQANQVIASVNPPAFNFDYAGEATKAYGELGAYYDRILKESQGDLNKALARLVEDYNRGIRFKQEDTTQQTQQAEKNIVNNALSRGLYQQSAFTPQSTDLAKGFGIPSQNVVEARQRINQGFNRYKEQADVNLARQQQDLPEQQQRKEFALEQERRQRAGELANERGAQAYNKYQASLF